MKHLNKIIACVLLLSTVVFTAVSGHASIIIHLDPGRGGPDAPVPVVNDFLTQNPGAGLTASSTLFNVVGPGGGSDFGATFANGTGQVIDGFTVIAGNNGGTPVTGDTGGDATNAGFSAGSAAHTDLNPITEGYAFNAGDNFVTIDGLLANSNAGDTIILSTWGIGDNIGQDSTFTASYGGNTAAEGNVQATLYNGGGARNDATGSIPFVNFTFVADGVTDQIRFDITDNMGGTVTLNAFSLAVIPEPTSLIFLLGLLGASVAFLRRKRVV